ncbi:hypothetical protein CK203_099600 [Vitis vinifera]|uniref:At1g61320/AtMIF1 LRR domain-containing protein n=1 Tax=Vitis vinifera TaxID=29760 RepID=A0A438E923_VITVI|nr:hypothetical protein CK203_099600 [Vitis vinifera]
MLRYLEVVGCWGVKTIEICDTNLVSFTYDGMLPKMHLKNVPLLVEERLRDYLLPELKNLKQFVLNVERRQNDCLLGFIAMIKNWPNLQRFVLQVNAIIFIDNILRIQTRHDHDKKRKVARRDLREAIEDSHQYLKVVEIEGYCNYSYDFELFKQIIENVVTLEKIIIDTHDPQSVKLQASRSRAKTGRRSRAKQLLTTQVPPGVELIVL